MGKSLLVDTTNNMTDAEFQQRRERSKSPAARRRRKPGSAPPPPSSLGTPSSHRRRTISKTASNSSMRKAGTSNRRTSSSARKTTQQAQPNQMNRMLRNMVLSGDDSDDDSTSSHSSKSSRSDHNRSDVEDSNKQGSDDEASSGGESDDGLAALMNFYPVATKESKPAAEEETTRIKAPQKGSPLKKASPTVNIMSMVKMAQMGGSSSSSDNDSSSDDNNDSFCNASSGDEGQPKEQPKQQPRSLSTSPRKPPSNRKIKYLNKPKKDMISQSEHSTSSSKASNQTAGFQVTTVTGNISTWEMRQKFKKEFPNEPIPSDDILRQLYRTEKVAEYERQERFKLENPGEPVPSDFVLKKLYKATPANPTGAAAPAASAPPPPPPPPPPTAHSPALSLGGHVAPKPIGRRELLTRQDSGLTFATEAEWEDYKKSAKSLDAGMFGKMGSNNLSVFAEGNEDEDEDGFHASWHNAKGLNSSKSSFAANKSNSKLPAVATSPNDWDPQDPQSKFQSSFASSPMFSGTMSPKQGGGGGFADEVGFSAAFPSTTEPTQTLGGGFADEAGFTAAFPSATASQPLDSSSRSQKDNSITTDALQAFHESFGSLDSFGGEAKVKKKKSNTTGGGSGGAADWAADFVVDGSGSGGDFMESPSGSGKKKSSSSKKKSSDKKPKKSSSKDKSSASSKEKASSSKDRGRSSKGREKESSKVPSKSSTGGGGNSDRPRRSKSRDRTQDVLGGSSHGPPGRGKSRDRAQDVLGGSSHGPSSRGKKTEKSMRGRRTIPLETDDNTKDNNNMDMNRSSHGRSKTRDREASTRGRRTSMVDMDDQNSDLNRSGHNRSGGRESRGGRKPSSSSNKDDAADRTEGSRRGRRTVDYDDDRSFDKDLNRSSHGRSRSRDKSLGSSRHGTRSPDLGSYMDGDNKGETSVRRGRRSVDSDDNSFDMMSTGSNSGAPTRGIRRRNSKGNMGELNKSGHLGTYMEESSVRRGRRTFDSDDQSNDMSTGSGPSRGIRRRNSKGNLGESSFGNNNSISEDNRFPNQGGGGQDFDAFSTDNSFAQSAFSADPVVRGLGAKSKSEASGDFGFGAFPTNEDEPSFPSFGQGERFFVESKSAASGPRLAPSKREVQRSRSADRLMVGMQSPGEPRRMMKQAGNNSNPNTPSGQSKAGIGGGFGTPTPGRPALSTTGSRSRLKGNSTAASGWMSEVPGVLISGVPPPRDEMSYQLEVGDTECVSPLTQATRKVVSRPAMGRRRGGYR